MSNTNIIWEGIYSTFNDAPVDDEVFYSDKWLSKQVQNITDIMGGNQLASITKNYPLTPVVAMILQQQEYIKILDYGGGLGKEYLSLINSIKTFSQIECTIVETSAIVKQGIIIFENDNNITFLDGFPDKNTRFDLVHAGSSLQYVDNWKEFLEELVSSKPKYLLLSDILAGDIPSFVTVQLYYGKNIRVRFLNKDELFAWLNHLGYTIILEEYYDGDIFLNRKALPMDNFPSEYQLKYSQNYIFCKN